MRTVLLVVITPSKMNISGFELAVRNSQFAKRFGSLRMSLFRVIH